MARPLKTPLAAAPKSEQPGILADHVEEFLARGGRIQKIPTGVGFMNTADGRCLLRNIIMLPGSEGQG